MPGSIDVWISVTDRLRKCREILWSSESTLCCYIRISLPEQFMSQNSMNCPFKVLSSDEDLPAALDLWKAVCGRPRRTEIKEKQKEIKQVARLGSVVKSLLYKHNDQSSNPQNP